ncbi:TIGR03936 family radical SAM-associated protein [Clostridiaceae bacterium OttesenSCG-928-D20]|nr:TIGR03936 family radical SAM-associated protein [Clostridiaceae bacterium OttesenSCG-928-D20]
MHESEKLRLKFTKTGRAIYISHLDLMRTLQRAFTRASIPLKYSEGFNPHAKISILLPLSLGMESVCELMDFQLGGYPPSDIIERLNRSLPEGISALKVYPALRKVREIKWLEVEGIFEYDEKNPADVISELRSFFEAESIIIEKKTKRGFGASDIRPAIKEISFKLCGEGIRLSAVISAQEPTLNPEYLAKALEQLKPEIAPDFAKFRRISLFDNNMKEFM